MLSYSIAFDRNISVIGSCVFLPIELLCSSRKEHIPTAVEGGFNGILDDTDDETFFKLRKKKLPIFQI